MKEGCTQRTGNLSVSLQNADFSDPRRKAIFGFSSADGSFSTTLGADDSVFAGSWTGSALTAGFAHVMLLSESDAGVVFEAEQASPVALQEGNTSRLSFDFDPPFRVPSGDSFYIQPSIPDLGAAPASALRVIAGMRYDDGTLLPLIDDPHGVGSYHVPLYFSGAHYSVAGSIGDTAPFLLAHREHAFTSPVWLPLRAPASLAAPADQASVSAGTTFSWAWGESWEPPIFFVWHLEAANGSGGLYVVTNDRQLAWPALAAELLLPGSDAVWSVETHVLLDDRRSPNLLAADVDTATGPKGFLEEFALRRDVALGPNVTDGIFTESERRTVHVGP